MTGPIVGIGELLWDLLPDGPRAGGAPFNFAAHCRQMGHPAVIVSRVGDDDLGRWLRAEVRHLGLSDEFIQIDPVDPTGTVEVLLDGQGVPSYRIVENVAWDHLEWTPALQALAEECRAVYFGTLAQRCLTTRATIRAFLNAASSESKKVCDINLRPPFDPVEIVAESIAMADWLKLSDHEWQALRTPLGFSLEATIESIRAKYNLSLVCLTRGAAGAVVVDERERVDIPGYPVQAVDTVGAGDSFTAGLLAQLLEGRPLSQAVRFANVFAALVASRPGGAACVARTEVEERC